MAQDKTPHVRKQPPPDTHTYRGLRTPLSQHHHHHHHHHAVTRQSPYSYNITRIIIITIIHIYTAVVSYSSSSRIMHAYLPARGGLMQNVIRGRPAGAERAVERAVVAGGCSGEGEFRFSSVGGLLLLKPAAREYSRTVLAAWGGRGGIAHHQ